MGPVHGTAAMYHLFLAYSFSTMLGYAYFALRPMSWHYDMGSALGAPEWLVHVAIAMVPFIVGTQVWRCIVARSVLFSQAETDSRIFDEKAIVDKLSNNDNYYLSKSFINKYGKKLMRIIPVAIALCALCQVVKTDGSTFWRVVVFASPYLIIYIPCGQTDHVLNSLTKISLQRAMAVCNALEEHLKKLNQIGSEPSHFGPPTRLADAEDRDPEFWEQISSQHLRLDADLECLWQWSSGGGLVFANIAYRVSLLLVCIFVAAGAHIPQVQVAFIVASTWVVVKILLFLWPMANVTLCCQSGSAGTKSIPRLCARFINHSSMSQKEQMAHGRFLLYLSTTPTGVELPFIGLVTIQGLVTAGKIAVTAGPVFLTFTVKAWASK